MAFYAYYRAWDTVVGEPKVGDEANHTVEVQVSMDGGMPVGVGSLTPVEVGDGVYVVSLSDGQCPIGARFAVHGSSSTAGVVIIGESGIRPEPMRGTDGANTTTPLSATGTRSALGLASADLDAQLAAIAGDVELASTHDEGDVAAAVWGRSVSLDMDNGTYGRAFAGATDVNVRTDVRKWDGDDVLSDVTTFGGSQRRYPLVSVYRVRFADAQEDIRDAVGMDAADMDSQLAAIASDVELNSNHDAQDVADAVRVELTVELARIDAAITSRSTLTANQVWQHATRTLSAFGFDVTLTAASATAVADSIVQTAQWTDLVDDAEAGRLAAEAAEEVTDQVATMIDPDGSGGYQFTSLSLANIPVGDGSEIVAGVLAGLGSDRIIRLGPGYNPSTGSWTLIKGNDHVHELDGHVDFSLDLPSVDLANATAKVGARSKNRGQFAGVASIVSSGDGYVLRIEWPKANLAEACPGNDYVVHAKVVTQDGSLELTKASGPLTLLEDATEPGS